MSSPNSVTDLLQRLRSLDLERLIGLRPPYPPVALQLGREALGLVRVARPRKGQPVLEAHVSQPISADEVPASIFDEPSARAEDLGPILRKMFDASGTRPGRISLVLPDNLSKITLLHLPERPASRKQFDALVRTQMRRAVPFKLEEARISYQTLAAEGRGVSVLVVLVRRALVELYEQALESIGARVGMVDLCTTNLINLCRRSLTEATRAGGDVAMLNCAHNYFSLAILRNERLIFLRCKTFALGKDPGGGSNGMLGREIASSFSYYEEKLAGEGVKTLFLRAAGTPTDVLMGKLSQLGISRIEPVDPFRSLVPADGIELDAEAGQWIAPAIGATLGRG